MSLYTHFANKEELLDLMYGEVTRRLYADTGRETWQEELLALGHQVRFGLLEHPRWTQLLLRPPPTITSEPRERLVSRMTRAGMSPEVALSTMASALLVAIGLTLVELAFRDPGGESTFGKTFDRLNSWIDVGNRSQVNVARVALSAGDRFDPEGTFRLTMRALVAGLEASTLAAKPA